MRRPFPPFQSGPVPGPGVRHGEHGQWWVHGLFELLIVVALVVGVVLVVHAVLRRTRPAPPPPLAPRHPAVEELDLRYARGELDRQDYLQRRADILAAAGGHPLPPPAGSASG